MESRIGRSWRAIKQNEALAQSQGLNIMAYKLLAFGVSALISSMVGGIFVFYLTLVDPSILDFYYTEASLIMVIVGGPGSFWGVLGGSVVFTILPELLRAAADLRMVIYGGFLIVAVLAFPEGLGTIIRRRPSVLAPGVRPVAQ
jgi:branched-chain amino acid transport system permease protein